MKRWHFYGSVFTIATLSVVVPCLLLSGEDGDPPTADESDVESEQVLSEFDVKAAELLVDPAFERYVDIGLLFDAVEGRDASLMTDLALQMAQGEAVLLRSHRAGTSEDMLRLAVQLAVDERDEDALGRIAKAADMLELNELAAEVEASKKLAGASRADEPALRVSVTETTPIAFAVYGELLRAIQDAELLGDAATLAEVEKRMGTIQDLSDEQREYLRKKLDEAKRKVGDGDVKNSIAATLGKLQGESRALRPIRPLRRPIRPLQGPVGRRPASIRPTAVRGLGVRPSAVRTVGVRPTAIRGLGVRPSAIR